MRYLAVDFGSTYTKLTAIDTDTAAVVGTAAAFTTIATDVREGFDIAMRRLTDRIGPFAYDEMLCCSSAGGGLTMVALGLVPELTSKAARMAAESAGAKVMRTFAFEISPVELDEIRAIGPDIVLLCGGTDGGNKDVILHNASQLGALEGNFSIIVAGNKSAHREVEAILSSSDKRWIITDNVMPSFGVLNIEPARQRIREIFIERIIDAKGLSRIQAQTPHAIIPTPLAVLKGCELLSLGTNRTPGIGEFVAIDVGGATTDVYSMAQGTPSLDNMLVKGLPEPYAKRTVEGDLGMRYSARFLLEDAGVDAVARAANVDEAAVQAWVALCSAEPEIFAPAGSPQRRIDEALGAFAMAGALMRHCGIMERNFTPMGEIYTLTGKDLSKIPCIIGIGGVLASSADPEGMLRKALDAARARAPQRMLPHAPACRHDTRYIFSAMGLLSMVDAELALAVMKKEMQSPQEKDHGVAK